MFNKITETLGLGPESKSAVSSVKNTILLVVETAGKAFAYSFLISNFAFASLKFFATSRAIVPDINAGRGKSGQPRAMHRLRAGLLTERQQTESATENDLIPKHRDERVKM